MTTREIGTIGENLAIKILKSKNFSILYRNFRVRSGEIDIICKKDNMISFIEVKSLPMFKNNIIFEPREQITKSKIFKIKNTANYFIATNDLYNISYKFDIMEIKF